MTMETESVNSGKNTDSITDLKRTHYAELVGRHLAGRRAVPQLYEPWNADETVKMRCCVPTAHISVSKNNKTKPCNEAL